MAPCMCAKLFVGSRRVKPCPRAEVNGGEEGEEEEEEFIQNRTRAGRDSKRGEEEGEERREKSRAQSEHRAQSIEFT